LVPGTSEHALAQEVLHHRPGLDGLSTHEASGVRSPGGTRRPGRGSAHARQPRSSVTTAPRPSRCCRHEGSYCRAPLPVRPREHPTSGPAPSPSGSLPREPRRCGLKQVWVGRGKPQVGLGVRTGAERKPAGRTSESRDPSYAAACGAGGRCPRAPGPSALTRHQAPRTEELGRRGRGRGARRSRSGSGALALPGPSGPGRG
jgi:hypothetical protein